jgi:hypothetical protein
MTDLLMILKVISCLIGTVEVLLRGEQMDDKGKVRSVV